MQTPHEGVAPATPSPGSTTMALENGGQGPDEAEMATDDEQLRMLIMGFATGLTIGGVFLIYIVLETAKLL